MTGETRTTPVVLVGLCAHGLGIARSLHRAGIRVIALETNPELPAYHTREAEIRAVEDINSAALIPLLVRLSTEWGTDRPVLMLTNDRMVEILGHHAEIIDQHYRLSWSASAPKVLELLDKSAIERRCRAIGLNYPRSVVLDALSGWEEALVDFHFPVIAKPTRPLSAFKTLVLDSLEDLRQHEAPLAASLPILFQEFIPGDDRKIRFGALYLDDGKILARFEGQKLRSYPMGHTTIAIPETNDAVFETARRFFDGLHLSGPVSLEVKQGPDGAFWIIEPTVGRTDFWVDLCIANGVNLPLIEYRALTGGDLPPSQASAPHLWLNGERDPGAGFWLAKNAPRSLFSHKIRGIYWDRNDPAPFWVATAQKLKALPGRIIRKLSNLLFKAPAAPGLRVERTAQVRDCPEILLQTFGLAAESGGIEQSANWYDNLLANVFKNDTGVCFYSLHDQAGILALFPLHAVKDGRLGTRIEALGNFYTSLYQPYLSPRLTESALAFLLRDITTRHAPVTCWQLSPMDPESREYALFMTAFRQASLLSFSYFAFGNWHLPITQSWPDYLAGRSGKIRHTLTRKARAFEKAGGRLILVREAQGIETHIRAYQEVYAASWKVPEPFPEFTPGLIRQLAAAGSLRLGLALLDELPVAAQVWIVAFGKASIFKLAYREDHRHYSAGTLLTAHLMEHVIEIDQVREVDYLIGDDSYKADWMTRRRERRGIIAYSLRSFGGILGGIQESLSRAIKALVSP